MLNILGLSRRAGKLECGFNKAIGSLKRNKAMLIILSSTLSDKTKKEAEYFCNKHNCPLIITDYTLEDLAKATGFKAGIFAVTDKGFAEKISSIANK